MHPTAVTLITLRDTGDISDAVPKMEGMRPLAIGFGVVVGTVFTFSVADPRTPEGNPPAPAFSVISETGITVVDSQVEPIPEAIGRILACGQWKFISNAVETADVVCSVYWGPNN